MESIDEDGMAARLRQARSRKYPTATAAAEALGLPEQTYLAHENGARGYWRRAPEYARHYRVRLQWLLTGKGTMEEENPIASRFDNLSPHMQDDVLRYMDFLVSRGEG